MGTDYSFDSLKADVLNQLESQRYQESTVTIYRRVYARIGRFMESQGILRYSPDIGKAFLEACFRNEITENSKSALRCMVRRLDDNLGGIPYRCHHGNPSAEISELSYRSILDEFICSCVEKGNKDATIRKKRVVCTKFFNDITDQGCIAVSRIGTEHITRACLAFENKDDYAIIRQLLSFMSECGYMRKDFSGIVPRYKRQMPIPTTYSMSEIVKIENAVDRATDTGKRDIAIVLLATRMGLRVGDITKLKVEKIDFDTGSINIIQEKTGTHLSLIMPSDVKEALITHLENSHRIDMQDGFVFHCLSAPYGRITTSAVRHTISKYISEAGIATNGRKHGPHAFRSSLASSMVNDGVPYDAVRKILGHTDPDAIKHYAKVDIERLRLCALTPPEPSGVFAEFLHGRRRV